SRRRHTRFSRDWSSDVCSSDLAEIEQPVGAVHWNLEPEADDQEDDRRLGKADDDGRNRLADQDLDGRERRDEQLIERALLTLAGDRKSVVEGKGVDRRDVGGGR